MTANDFQCKRVLARMWHGQAPETGRAHTQIMRCSSHGVSAAHAWLNRRGLVASNTGSGQGSIHVYLTDEGISCIEQYDGKPDQYLKATQDTGKQPDSSRIGSAPPGRIFISYRRQDSNHLAGRLYDRLTDRFGEGQVFMDVDAIKPGVDFVEEINGAVAACTVLLAIIGPNWLTAADEWGRRRLDTPGDYVRLEIEAAIARDVRVIPILAEGAVMLGREDLPESLAGLAHRNAVLIRYESFRSDAGRLVTALERVLA